MPTAEFTREDQNAELVLAVQAGTDAEVRSLAEGLQPFDLAGAIGALEAESDRLRLLSLLSPEQAAETLEHLDFDVQYALINHLPEPITRAILHEMSSDAVVDLANAMHPRQAERLLGWLPPDYAEQVRALMTYPENTAGGRMTLDYIQVRQTWSAQRVLDHVRKVGREAEVVLYVYVVDAHGRLVGITSLRSLILADPATPVGEFMQENVITIPATADQEEAARVLAQYDLVALPVIAAGGRLVGVITHDDVLDVLEEEATEDIARLGGTEPLEQTYLRAGFLELIKKRAGWLLVLFLGQSLTSTILRHYEGLLDQVVALAFFIPLLLGTGGNAGSQAATLVVRAMAVGEVAWGDFLRVVWREVRLGILLGVLMSAPMLIRAVTLQAGIEIALTVAAAVVVVVMVACTAGAALPMLGKRLGLDPAVVATPLITTVVDSAGLLVYFGMAWWLLLSP